ncbi:unnamed protein product [Caenorhabditis angaria]|uniref:Uncharacterized protein n=1 Tax=Caenorhabditis angaria TaxID=860376 RepID=A0A9P1MY09_9PELO|nr:unnamed protein product [Caenorhabditis angaria]
MTFMLCCFWAQWIEAAAAKIIMMPYQYGVLLVGESNKSHTSWWTSDPLEMVKITNFQEILPLFIASLLNWHYAFSMLLGVATTGIERIFATYYIHDYESTSRKHIPIFLVIFTHLITVPCAYFMTYNKIPYVVGYGMVIVLMAFVFVAKRCSSDKDCDSSKKEVCATSNDFGKEIRTCEQTCQQDSDCPYSYWCRKSSPYNLCELHL